MNEKQTKELLQRYLAGKASENEQAAVDKWYVEHAYVAERPAHTQILSDKNENWNAIQSKIAQSRPSKLHQWKRIGVAASILITVLTAGYFYTQLLSKPKPSIPIDNDIAPGKNGATLTLGNGRKISIKTALSGSLANESGVKISQTKDGEIIYELEEESDRGSLAYNTLSTTRKEQIQLILPDGTHVFLNSESSLRYPANFAKTGHRMVSLQGEGFFNVTEDKSRPFIVKTKNQQVEVLGTQFNINSYEDVPLVKTTLLEGEVKITLSNKINRLLKPDQQAVVSDNSIQIANVEAQFSIDWKTGFFMFDNENLESIMKRVSRWYDIQVIFEDNSLKAKKITGTVDKFKNISVVIQTLEQGGFADFSMEKGILKIRKRD